LGDYERSIERLQLFTGFLPLISEIVGTHLIRSLAFAIKRGIFYFSILQIRDWCPASG
jgi:hypothetical protein